MKLTFNLKKAFNTIRQAMAGGYHAYGKQMQWWRLDEIENGDEAWKEWVEGDPEKGLKPNSSLINALADARNDYYKKKLTFRARYGCTDDEVDVFYSMFIGYSPMKGMYAMHIGPYTAMGGAWERTIQLSKDHGAQLTSQGLLNLSNSLELPDFPEGFDVNDPKNRKDPLTVQYKNTLRDKRGCLEVRADLMNKFSYFLKTYNKIDRANMNKGINIYLRKLLNSVGPMFTEDDIGVIVKSFPSDKVGQLEGYVKKVNSEFKSVNPDDPKGAELMASGILLGQGSTLTLNSRGMNKLLQKTALDGNWQDLYEQAIKIIAHANEKSIADTRYLVAEDDAFSTMLLDQLYNVQEELKNAGDFRADFLNIAMNKKPKTAPKVGAQRTQTYRISRVQKSIISLKKEILKTILDIGSDDPTKVAEALNLPRKMHKTMAKGEFNGEMVSEWLSAIKAEDQETQKMKKKKQVRTYQEIFDSTSKDYTIMNQNEDLRDAGQEDLETAYRLASTTFMESPLEYIDKKYRTKLQLPNAPNMFARENDSNDIINSKIMTKMRMEARAMGTEEQLKKALKEEIQKEIGEKDVPVGAGLQGDLGLDPMDVSDPADPADPANPVAPTPDGQPVPELDFDVTNVPQEKTPVDPEVEQPEEPVAPPKKLDLKNLFGHTLQSLIVMARDLDSQGKEDASEEIHKIIRKYQGRI